MEELWKFRTPSTTVRVVTIIYPFCWLPPQTDNRFRVQLLIRIIATSKNIDSFVYSLLLRCSTNSQQQQHSDPFRLFLLRGQTSLRLFANSINILNPRSSQVPNRRWTVLCARLNPRGVARNRFTSTAHFSSPKGLLSEGKQDFKGKHQQIERFSTLGGEPVLGWS